MGFRGEALASIAAVSKITLRTKQIGSSEGSIIRIDDGAIVEHGPAGCPEGTSILVEYLFYNTPARYKFLKKDTTEGSYITDIIERFILARPDVSFRLIQNSQEILHSPGNNDLKSAIFSVYGKSVTQSILPISYQTDRITIDGFVGKPEIGRNTRQNQSVFVNQRYVKSKTITAAVEEGYKTLLMKGKFAFCVINVTLSPALIDVNVHPQKTEVKFWNDQEIFLAVLHAIKEALSAGITIQDIVHEEKKTSNAFKSKSESESESEADSAVASKSVTDSTAGYQYPIQQEIQEPSSVLTIKEDSFLTIKEESFHPLNYSVKGEPSQLSESSGAAAMKLNMGLPLPDSIDIKVNELSKARYIGVLFHTYLLLELDGNMVLIDQHAAHERILFEKLVVKYKSKNPIAQPLLAPEIIELAAHETAFVRDHLEILTKIGFECEVFGTQSIVLRTVPLGIKEINIKETFQSVLDVLKAPVHNDEDNISDAFYSIACKAAVKAHDTLDELEVRHLLEELQQIPNPTHCPHGRPVLLKISKYEIEKDFKRIVT